MGGQMTEKKSVDRSTEVVRSISLCNLEYGHLLSPQMVLGALDKPEAMESWG